MELERPARCASTKLNCTFSHRCLHDDAVIGVEALVWRHPERACCHPPASFPGRRNRPDRAAGRVGAAAAGTHWRDAGLPLLRVAVNISARQFNDDQLPALIENLLREHEQRPICSA